MLDDYGSLSVRLYTASGALPVADALVRISGADEDNRFVFYSLVTDNDGTTPILELPAPSKEYSMTPDPEYAPYSTYDVEVLADGYATKHIRGIPVFSGVHSLLPVSMLPHNSDFNVPNTSSAQVTF